MPTPVKSDSNLSKNEIQKIKDEWKAWAEKTDCDFDGFFSLYGIQSLVMRNVAMQGEVFVLKRRDSSSRHPFVAAS